MSKVLRGQGRWWRDQDQDHEHAPAVGIMLAVQTPGLVPKEFETVPGLCPDLLSWEKRGVQAQGPLFHCPVKPSLCTGLRLRAQEGQSRGTGHGWHCFLMFSTSLRVLLAEGE